VGGQQDEVVEGSLRLGVEDLVAAQGGQALALVGWYGGALQDAPPERSPFWCGGGGRVNRVI
jgi:hypothetical protein